MLLFSYMAVAKQLCVIHFLCAFKLVSFLHQAIHDTCGLWLLHIAAHMKLWLSCEHAHMLESWEHSLLGIVETPDQGGATLPYACQL